MDAKYFAGFLDSDGSVAIQARKLTNGKFTLQARVTLTQLTHRADVINEVAEFYGVSVNKVNHDEGWNEASTVILTCKKAVNFLQHVRNHLVIKQSLADYIMTLDGQVVNEEVLKAIKGIIKNIRNSPKQLTKSEISSRWLAGYFDGDGCLRAQVRENGNIALRAEVTTYKWDTSGVELLQKVYGGSIHRSGPNAIRWVKHLDETNCKVVLGDIVKHSRIKRTQLEYALGFVGNGKHLLRKGGSKEANITFKENLQQMKQPHRLSESGPYKG